MKKLVDIVGKEVFDELPDETKKEYGVPIFLKQNLII